MTETSQDTPTRDANLAAPVATEVGWTDLDVRAVDTARILAADAVQKVGNGHPGTAMSLAPVAYLLYQNVMKHDPSDPHWLGRDRFVLSCGHSSLTQYVQLYLNGYGLELSDLQALRTWGSLTPGHPEVHHTTGVELTTGPLGSGLATAVGMAMAQRRQRGLLDPDAAPGTSPFDHHIWVLASDGDIMEGVASEASSLAGHQELGNLTLIYDQNFISIEDDTDISFSEDVAKRYEAYGWNTETIDWRADTWSSWFAIITMVNWRWTGYWAIIFLAAMQSISKELYEAATIDGAGPWRQFWRLTVPLIRPAIVFAVVMSSIGGLQLFTEPLLFDLNVADAGGGADGQWQTVQMYIFRVAWRNMNLGYAAALSWILFLIIVVVAATFSLLTNRIGGRK